MKTATEVLEIFQDKMFQVNCDSREVNKELLRAARAAFIKTIALNKSNSDLYKEVLRVYELLKFRCLNGQTCDLPSLDFTDELALIQQRSYEAEQLVEDDIDWEKELAIFEEAKHRSTYYVNIVTSRAREVAASDTLTNTKTLWKYNTCKL